MVHKVALPLLLQLVRRANALGFSTIAIGENSNAKTTTGAAPSLAIGRNTIANGDLQLLLVVVITMVISKVLRQLV